MTFYTIESAKKQEHWMSYSRALPDAEGIWLRVCDIVSQRYLSVRGSYRLFTN